MINTKSENQITLGQFIERLKQLNPDLYITYSFASLIPTDFDSYRGHYSDLALGFDLEAKSIMPTVKTLLNDAETVIGLTFVGYKGGEYIAHEDRPLWAANYGRCGSTAITGIRDDGHWAYIETEFVEQ